MQKHRLLHCDPVGTILSATDNGTAYKAASHLYIGLPLRCGTTLMSAHTAPCGTSPFVVYGCRNMFHILSLRTLFCAAAHLARSRAATVQLRFNAQATSKSGTCGSLKQCAEEEIG